MSTRSHAARASLIATLLPTFAAALLLSAGPLAAQSPTYYQDVRPILVENCVRCHNGEGAAWSMLDAEATFDRRARIARAILDRQMPPWLAEDGHQEYIGNPMLEDYKLSLVQGWRDGGYAKGDVVPDGMDADVASSHTGAHSAAHSSFAADLSLDVLPGSSYTPNPSRTDDYRCFVVDWTPDREAFITGFRAVPGNRKVAHHFVVYAIAPNMAQRFRELADDEPGPGYQCFGGAVPDRLGRRADRAEYEQQYPNGVRELNRGNFWLAHWAPGMDGHVFPAGTGIRMQPGSVLVVQLHYYSKEAPGERDEGSRLDFMTAPTVERPAFHLAQTNNDWMNGDQPGSIRVPARDTATVSLTEDLGDYLGYIASVTGVARDDIDAIELHSANLHMHGIGQSGDVALERRNGARETLLSIPRWDLGWQRDFTFVEPKVFARDEIAGTKLRVRCTYFNPREQPVFGGLGSDEEMCFNFTYIAVREKPPADDDAMLGAGPSAEEPDAGASAAGASAAAEPAAVEPNPAVERASSVQPQASAFVRPGDRVRVTTYQRSASARGKVGVLQGANQDSVTVAWTSGATETLPLHTIERLDVSDGRGSFIGLGMGFGFLGGAVIGAIAGASTTDSDDEYFGLTLAVTTIGGALIGTVAGGLVGAIGRRERWTRVRLDSPLRRVSITPHVMHTRAGPTRFGVQVRALF